MILYFWKKNVMFVQFCTASWFFYVASSRSFTHTHAPRLFFLQKSPNEIRNSLLELHRLFLFKAMRMTIFNFKWHLERYFQRRGLSRIQCCQRQYQQFGRRDFDSIIRKLKLTIVAWSFYALNSTQKKMNVTNEVWILIAFRVYVTTSLFNRIFQHIGRRNLRNAKTKMKMKKPTTYTANVKKLTTIYLQKKREFKVKLFCSLDPFE